jgi:hypothetical protein
MSESLDIAVDLGAVPEPMPEIEFVEDLAKAAPVAPPQLVEGMLHRGCKMTLGGMCKSYKSWCLLDLGLSVASGQPWWGRRTAQAPVVYLNFELPRWAIWQRIHGVCDARPEIGAVDRSFAVWNLRGRSADLALLRPTLEEQLTRHEFGLIIVDPMYKLLGNRDEHANGDVAGLLNEVDVFCQKFDAAVVIGHHFAKGDSTAKSAIDRMSGAGAWARDPDALLMMTPHEEEDCYTVSSILRNLPKLEDFVVQWDFPLMRVAKELNPEALRRPQGRNKICTEREFMEAVLGDGVGKAFGTIVKDGASLLNMSRRTVANYLKRAVDSGLVRCSGGLYWQVDLAVGQQR